MPTIRDVAKMADVSLSTVSHVINGTRPVSDELRQRVLEAVAATKYRQDALARALRRSRTDSIGVVVSDTGQHVFAGMIRGIEHGARAAGYTLLLANSDEDLQRETESVRALLERRVDGLILAQVSGSPHRLVENVRKEVPLVLLDRLSAPDIDQVGVDGIGAMRFMIDHLISNGHRDIGLIAGDVRVPTLHERMQGYMHAMSVVGLPVRPDRVITSGSVSTRSGTRAAVRALLEAGPSPTAIANASNSDATAGMIDAIRDLGMTIPNDIAVVAFDELAYGDLLSPRLTSMMQPAYEIGCQAVSLLLKRMNEPDGESHIIRLVPSLAHGESCGCALGIDLTFPAD